jgi:hypothetical protein
MRRSKMPFDGCSFVYYRSPPITGHECLPNVLGGDFMFFMLLNFVPTTSLNVEPGLGTTQLSGSAAGWCTQSSKYATPSLLCTLRSLQAQRRLIASFRNQESTYDILREIDQVSRTEFHSITAQHQDKNLVDSTCAAETLLEHVLKEWMSIQWYRRGSGLTLKGSSC